MNRQIWLKVTAIDLLMLCFSISVSIIGQMLGPIREAYSLSLTQSGWLLSSQSIGGITLALLTIIYSGMNKERFVLISGMILGSMLLLLGARLPVFLLFAVFALMGYAGSTINALSNSVISDNLPAGKTDRHLALLHMSFSAGAVATPILSQYLYSKSGLSGVFFVFSAFIILSVAYAFFAYRKKAVVKTAKRKLTMGKRALEAAAIFKNPGIPATFVLAVLMSSAQLCMVYFVSSYFSEAGGSANFGAAALSTFFLSMMVSRLIYSRIAGKFPRKAFFAAANAAAFISWGIMFFVPGSVAKMVFLALGSVLSANNFPIIFADAMEAAPKSKGAATGLAVLGYYIALLLYLPAAGALGERFGLKFSIAGALPALLAASLLGLLLYRRQKKRNAQ